MGSRISRMLRKPLETGRRLDKVLESKPVVAPKHPSTRDTLERLKSETEHKFKERDSKDDQFLHKLKVLRVESSDLKMPQSPDARKPQDRSKPSKSTSGGILGKLTSREMSELFAKNMASPSEWKASTLAQHYKLSDHDVSNLLKYYSGYAVVEKGQLPMPLNEVKFLD
ncbi:predicted protein [Nematostella vectensis]|uniref:NADH dehydrogenase [ubiquinone] 1 alpha subcomplex assembly factor 4 n=1 Tax=Nematostella vectensis TaxID=45351 RepID=A7SJR3_NEMVE|nr:NADH dehydrogenase [ubiquinone] 1 alpha subcomplex assembly factor 4 [Nematostella vectensis]EDO36045.1 predicted protein [Nematostella vectensis]|eukprot:XP_001628108.1 predicted protein [Nematostella vectensis]